MPVGIENRLEEISRRLSCIEREVAVLKSRSGTVQVSPSVLGLFWTILLAIVAVVVFIVRVDAATQENTKAIERVTQVLVTHIERPAHQVSGERMAQIEARLARIEKLQERR